MCGLRNNLKRSVLFFLLLLIPACNIPTNSQFSTPDIQQAIDSTSTQIATNLAATAALETQVAVALASTLSAMTPESAPVSTPEPNISTVEVAVTGEVAKLTVSVETYCRSGPGTIYESMGILPIGQPAEVIARNEYSDDWLIKLPSNPNTTCWVYGKYASISGDTQAIPRVTPPPTPTPFVDFEVQYVNVVLCYASYALRFNVLNTGQVAWESIQITFNNHTRGVVDVYTSDYFQAYAHICGTMDSDFPALPPGELLPVTSVSPHPQAGGVGHFNYDPEGNNFTVTFLLCSQDGLQGTCTSHIMDLVP